MATRRNTLLGATPPSAQRVLHDENSSSANYVVKILMEKLSPACCRTRGGLFSRRGGKICPPNIQLALHLASPGAWRSKHPQTTTIYVLRSISLSAAGVAPNGDHCLIGVANLTTYSMNDC